METTSRKTDREKDSFERIEKIMKMYSDNADGYIKLAGLALALTLTVAREILHIPKDANIANGWMIAMWICFLITILAASLYQYMAAKSLEYTNDHGSYPYQWRL